MISLTAPAARGPLPNGRPPDHAGRIANTQPGARRAVLGATSPNPRDAQPAELPNLVPRNRRHRMEDRNCSSPASSTCPIRSASSVVMLISSEGRSSTSWVSLASSTGQRVKSHAVSSQCRRHCYARSDGPVGE